MKFDITYAEAIEMADHYIAVGDTAVYLQGDDFPWDKAVDVEKGSSYRLNGPTCCYIIAHDSGLTFKKNIDFEERDANGRSVSLFDRTRLRDVVMKLPVDVRPKFADMMRTHVLPGLEKTTAEWRGYLNRQLDSEDCVRGLIAFAEEQP